MALDYFKGKLLRGGNSHYNKYIHWFWKFVDGIEKSNDLNPNFN